MELEFHAPSAAHKLLIVVSYIIIIPMGDSIKLSGYCLQLHTHTHTHAYAHAHACAQTLT